MFNCPSSHSLAHCISADAKMSKGIAKQFVSNFPLICTLRGRRNTVGTAVVVPANNRFIYNLVSKQKYWMKPSLASLFSSLTSMYQHASQNGVYDISMPKIASGCDGLDFEMHVLPMINSLFHGSSVSVHIFSCIAVSRYVLFFHLILRRTCDFRQGLEN